RDGRAPRDRHEPAPGQLTGRAASAGRAGRTRALTGWPAGPLQSRDEKKARPLRRCAEAIESEPQIRGVFTTRIFSMTHSKRSRSPRELFRMAVAAWAFAFAAASFAQPPRIPDGYISGVVESENGPEAGVWVIAETTELKTPFVKIVVTDDDGRYVLPEMPEATYNVWVRGYGLVDSTPVEGRPGDHELELEAVVAATPQEAAQVYPGDYWLSLLELPGE